MGTVPDTHASGKLSTCTDMDMVTYPTIMLHNCPSVHNDIDTHDSASIHHCPRVKDRAGSHLSPRRTYGRWMTNDQRLQPAFQAELEKSTAYTVITDAPYPHDKSANPLSH
jgi:hypothetical protein